MFEKIVNRNSRAPYNPFKEPLSIPSQIQHKDVEEALVIDCVVNDTHPEYSMDGYNVGAIKFKLIDSQIFRNESTLSWAWPLDPTTSEYPLLNEIVLIHKVLNRFFYSRPINVSNKPNVQAFFGLRDELNVPDVNEKKSAMYAQTEAGVPVRLTRDSSAFILGKYFKNNQRTYRLRHDEGDKIIEGRSGQSIRFGHAWKDQDSLFKTTGQNQSPNLILRVGSNESPNIESLYGLVTENINADASSLWLVTDQIIDYQEPTKSSREHKKSIEDYPSRFDGANGILSSNQIIISAKSGKIFGFSNLGIHWTTSKNFTVDTNLDYLSYIGNNSKISVGRVTQMDSGIRFSINSPKVYLGTLFDRTSPTVLGNILAEFLDKFLGAHLDNATRHVVTPVGPGSLSPRVINALTQLRNDVARGKLASFNSVNVFGS